MVSVVADLNVELDDLLSEDVVTARRREASTFADVAGRPLDDPEPVVAHGAGSARVLRSRNSSNPATPISRPIPDCL